MSRDDSYEDQLDPSEAPRQTGEELRATIRNVTLYKQIRDGVRRSSTGSLFFGAIMLALWYFVVPDADKYKPIFLLYIGLGLMEFCVGLYNRLSPSPEGILFSGIVLLCFTGATIIHLLVFKRFSPFQVLAIFWAMNGIRSIRAYFDIIKALPMRPTHSDLRWYKEMLASVRSADPVEDPLALDLPTDPPYRAKLLGENAFFATPGTDELIVLGMNEFEIQRLPKQADEETPRARLMFLFSTVSDFDLDAENWRNYTQWKQSQQIASQV